MGFGEVIICQRQVQHLIEITVVDIALPVDTDQVMAHNLPKVDIGITRFQQVHVFPELSLRNQGAAEALNRHIGYREQAVEHNAKLFEQMLFIVLLQCHLWRRQAWSLRVVDKVQM